MSVRKDWDNALWNQAYEIMADSHKEMENDRCGKSWALAGYARVLYLSNLIMSIVLIPFVLLATLFGLAHALVTWNHKSEYLVQYSGILYEKINQVGLSNLGIFAPSLVYKNPNLNSLPVTLTMVIVNLTLALKS